MNNKEKIDSLITRVRGDPFLHQSNSVLTSCAGSGNLGAHMTNLCEPVKTPNRGRRPIPSLLVPSLPARSKDPETEKKLRDLIKNSGKLLIKGSRYSTRMDELEHLGELGSGTCGHVVQMRHLNSGEIIAVKQMRRSGNEEENKRIAMDIDVVLNSQSPYIVRCLGYFITESDVWICMELMTTCFDKLLKRLRQPIPENILGKVTVATIRALSYLKEKHSVIHRDVKPSNILIDRLGNIKLCDFGISGRLVDSMAKTKSAGCAAYMAPERIEPSNPLKPSYDTRADVWSLGITLVELATGTYPYKDCKNDFEVLTKVLCADPPSLPRDKDFSDKFRSFINDCLIKEKEMRPKYPKLMEHPFVKYYEKADVNVASWFASVWDTEESPSSRRYIPAQQPVMKFSPHFWQNSSLKNSLPGNQKRHNSAFSSFADSRTVASSSGGSASPSFHARTTDHGFVVPNSSNHYYPSHPSRSELAYETGLEPAKNHLLHLHKQVSAQNLAHPDLSSHVKSDVSNFSAHQRRFFDPSPALPPTRVYFDRQNEPGNSFVPINHSRKMNSDFQEQYYSPQPIRKLETATYPESLALFQKSYQASWLPRYYQPKEQHHRENLSDDNQVRSSFDSCSPFYPNNERLKLSTARSRHQSPDLSSRLDRIGHCIDTVGVGSHSPLPIRKNFESLSTTGSPNFSRRLVPTFSQLFSRQSTESSSAPGSPHHRRMHLRHTPDT